MTPTLLARALAALESHTTGSGHLMQRWPISHLGNCTQRYHLGQSLGVRCVPSCVEHQRLVADLRAEIDAEAAQAPRQISWLEAS